MTYHGFPNREAYDRAKREQSEIAIPRDMERFVGKRVGPLAAQYWKSPQRIAEEAYLQGILDAAQRELA